MAHPVYENRRGYRQGLVLGLTMAEIMLLLLFCLLLAAAALLKQANDDRDQLQQRVSNFEELSQELPTDLPAEIRLEAIALLQKIRSEKLDPRTALSVVEWYAAANAKAIRENKSFPKEAELVAFLDASKRIERKLGRVPISADWEKLERISAVLQKEEELDAQSDSLVREVEAFSKLRSESADKGNPLPTILDLLKSSTAAGEHSWPPIIRLGEADGYYFELGKASLTDKFRSRLTTSVIPKLVDTMEEYGVDVIEVVGHTDEVRVKEGLISNLDEQLIRTIRENADVADLIASDNAGLGMARAVAVALILRSDPRLKRYRIIPLSGAQLIDERERLSTGTGATNVRERRRIEIRIRRQSWQKEDEL